MSKNKKYIIDPENLERDNVLKKLAKLFIWMLNFYSKINNWIFTALPKGIGNLLGWKEDHWLYKLLKNEFIANFFSIIVLYLLAHSIFIPPVLSLVFYYWASFNIVVICGKALTWDSKSKEILEED